MSVFVLPDPDTVTVGGLRFAALTEGEVVHRVRTALARGIGGRIATPNVDILRQAALDPSIRDELESADLLVADGAPLIWAARLSGTPLPERVTGSGLIWALSAGLAIDGSSVYLLGGDPASNGAARAADRLLEHYPGLRIAGAVSPSFGFDAQPRSLQKVLSRVVEAEPDLVFVGLGFPKQEAADRAVAPGAAVVLVPRLRRSCQFRCGRLPTGTGVDAAHRAGVGAPARVGAAQTRPQVLARGCAVRGSLAGDLGAAPRPGARRRRVLRPADTRRGARLERRRRGARTPDHVASAVTLEVPPVLEAPPALPERRRPRPRPHR
jgi:N-acetylglucosaminyldiphosphoundecaprenol N-acetyl-beta-D-mannosaminyltransferase